MKQINVVAAVIRNTENRILATQRGYGEWTEISCGLVERTENRILCRPA